MAARPGYADVEVGTMLPAQSFAIERRDLVRYCGASGDFNVIHWNQRVAVEVGLPDVIAHGMYTMALASRIVTDWAGDPGALLEYGVRFTRPVVVPDDGQGAVLVVSGVVSAKLADDEVLVDLTAQCGEAKVLAKAQARVRLG